VDPATLAGGLDGYSAADIAQVCEEATDLAFDREQDQGRPTMLTPDDFARAIESVKPSLSAEDIQRDHDIRRRMETRP
jgi:SpoVK/Ycf46/Vps4 family AAA+-type ATPase